MIDLVPQSFTNLDANIDFFQKLVLATLIGILIGIERESKRTEKFELIAGVRSFTIACIAGMLSSYLELEVSPGILLITLAFFALTSILYIYIKNILLKQPGITGPIALYCTFLLGVLITHEFYLKAIIGAVLITLLLAEKSHLHTFATNLTGYEIQSAVRFLAVVFILFPITPDRLFYGVINPRWVLLIVIIVATISFISFVIMKKMGVGRGISLSGMLGGLVNSEATTGALAAMAKKRKELVESSYVGIILSNAAMLIRNLVIAFIVDPGGKVFLIMAPPILFIALFNVAVIFRSKTDFPMSETIKLQSPFALSTAVKFAFGFAGLSIFAKFANMWAGAAGVYATAIGGIISSAVVTASSATLAANNVVQPETAAFTAVLASIISTGNKILLVKLSGSLELTGMIRKTFINSMIIGLVVLTIWGVFINYAY